MKRLIFALIWIFSITFPARAEKPAGEQITVGALAELTGRFAKLGEDCRNGYQLAEAELQRPSLRVVIADNQSDPKAGISEFRRLVDTERARLIITSRSPVGLALNPISAQQKIPLIGIVGHPDFVKSNPYAVRIFPSSADEAEALAGVIAHAGAQDLAIVTLEDDYFLALTKALEQKAEGTRVVFSETVSPQERDFSSFITRLRGKNPGAVFVNLAPAQIAPFVKKLREAQLSMQLYANFAAGSEEVRKDLGAAGEGLAFAELDYTRPNFLAALEKRTGKRESSPIGYSCYVALLYAAQLLEAAGPSGSAESISSAIGSLRSISTPDGPIAIDQREARFKVAAKRIESGVVVSAE